jgi:hypothetical protein
MPNISSNIAASLAAAQRVMSQRTEPAVSQSLNTRQASGSWDRGLNSPWAGPGKNSLQTSNVLNGIGFDGSNPEQTPIEARSILGL